MSASRRERAAYIDQSDSKPKPQHFILIWFRPVAIQLPARLLAFLCSQTTPPFDIKCCVNIFTKYFAMYSFESACERAHEWARARALTHMEVGRNIFILLSNWNCCLLLFALRFHSSFYHRRQTNWSFLFGIVTKHWVEKLWVVCFVRFGHTKCKFCRRSMHKFIA